MNVMLVAVSERRKEIGIRRALGAMQIDIRAQFLVESVILCLAGGVIGIALGVGAAYVLAKVNEWIFFVSGMGLVLGVGSPAPSEYFSAIFQLARPAASTPFWRSGTNNAGCTGDFCAYLRVEVAKY